MNNFCMRDIIDLVDKGIDVFGSYEMFKKYLNSKNSAFENKKPIDSKLSDIYNELLRIEHGVF